MELYYLLTGNPPYYDETTSEGKEIAKKEWLPYSKPILQIDEDPKTPRDIRLKDLLENDPEETSKILDNYFKKGYDDDYQAFLLTYTQ